MSVLPILLDLAETLTESSVFDNDFGFGIHPHEISRLRGPKAILSLPKRRHTPYAIDKKKTGKKKSEDLTVGKDGFQVCMDVQQFKPNELTVKTMDNYVVIEGKHEERQDDHGLISRHFVRKYSIPRGYDSNQIVSTLSSDGILTVGAPPPTKAIAGKQRIIQIQQTGPAHLSIKENPKEDSVQGEKIDENMEN